METRQNSVQIRSETETRDPNSALMSVCSINDPTGPLLNTVARTESKSRLCTLRPLFNLAATRLVRPETIGTTQQDVTAACETVRSDETSKSEK